MSMGALQHLEETRIAFVLTSCARFDLLEETIETFLEYNTAPIDQYLIIEDSGDAHVRDVVSKFDAPIDVIVNDPPIGQLRSIDRAYAAVDAPFIYHCEDDWRFFRSGFVEECLELLRFDPTISTVVCRRLGQNSKHDLISKAPMRVHKGIRYRKRPLWSQWDWGGYSFNPGLRRLADYKKLGSFAKWSTEKDVSLFFKRLGMSLAVLEEPACETTGKERRVAMNSPQPSLRARLQRIEGRLRHALATKAVWPKDRID